MARKRKATDKLDTWALIRFMWENSTVTYRELEIQLKGLLSDDNVPSYTSINKKAKQEGWSRKTPNQQATSDTEMGLVIATAQERIQAKMDSIVADAETKKDIIIANRNRVNSLGEMFDAVMDGLTYMRGLDINEHSEEILQQFHYNKGLTEMLGSLASVQKIIGEQQFALYQITPDDFGVSEAQRRAESLALMGDIDEQERQIRQAQLPELMNRLKDFESLNIDDVELVEIDDDGDDDE